MPICTCSFGAASNTATRTGSRTDSVASEFVVGMFPTDTLQNGQHQIASHDSFRCREVFVFQFESSPSLRAPLDYPLLLLPHRVSSASVHLFTSFAVQSHPAARTGE